MALEDVIKVSDITILTLICVIEGFVFIRLKFKVDFSGIVTLLLHLVVSALRVINSVKFQATRHILQVITSVLIWISLYYFTFEMAYIQATLSSDSSIQHYNKKRKITLIKIILIGYQSLFMVLFDVQSVFLELYYTTYEDYYNFFSIFGMVLSSLKFVSDLYLVYLFPTLLFYFLRYRTRQANLPMTSFNYFIMYFVFFQYLLVVVHVFVSLIDSAMKLIIHDFWISPEYDLYEKPFYTLVFPIKDLLIAISLSMLYYH
jgi:hypothetical protein